MLMRPQPYETEAMTHKAEARTHTAKTHEAEARPTRTLANSVAAAAAVTAAVHVCMYLSQRATILYFNFIYFIYLFFMI